MKVSLNESDAAIAHQGKGFLRKGMVYPVLSIEVRVNGPTKYRIAPELQGTPALFDARIFVIVDGALPARWRVTAKGDRVEFEPSAWAASDFWSRYFDGDEEAIRIYDEEVGKMVDS